VSYEWVIGVVVQVVLMAAAWGDMRRQVQSNRERQDDRHTENQEMLHAIDDKVDRINGTVARHGERLDTHASEIDRLRGRRRD
jgi:hypothetical protein